MTNSQNQPLTIRNKLVFITGGIIILFSCVPLLCGLVNIAPTIEYSQKTGVNYSLNYMFPLLVAGVIFIIGLSIMIAPIVMRHRNKTENNAE